MSTHKFNDPNDKDYTPIVKTKKDVNEEAKRRINEERSGKQLGLKTRFSRLNIALGKYFRFGTVTLIAGPSGHGKSTLLNMLLNDFVNKELNKYFEEEFIIVHNALEMAPSDEVLRNVGNKVEKSHMNLLSSEYNKQTGRYNEITELEYQEICRVLDETEDQPYYYFDEPVGIGGISYNIAAAVRRWKEDNYPNEEPNIVHNPKVVVAIDHTLLMNQNKGENNLDFMTRLAKYVIWLKKRGYLIIIIGQFNNEIEKPERIRNNSMHYPLKSDIYAQAQIYNACDNVLTFSQPELLGIALYGIKNYITTKLGHLQVIKQRFGSAGSIWLKNELHRGQLVEFKPETKVK